MLMELKLLRYIVLLSLPHIQKFLLRNILTKPFMIIPKLFTSIIKAINLLTDINVDIADIASIE